ncbi:MULTISPECIES: glutaredoxin family protein [unclassified Virgibacillus]|uniref:glutaredoxin family protein n=1 Tax=unclassified Virgibacillus TaxID=2620237 RepID=UPI0024DE2596|nr:glutaredoxin family protein [Virgibacillus sp. LDC-1]
MMKQVILYTKANCPLCDEAKTLLELLQTDYSFSIEERDIYSNDSWLETYQLTIPHIVIGETEFDCRSIQLDVMEEALLKT